MPPFNFATKFKLKRKGSAANRQRALPASVSRPPADHPDVSPEEAATPTDGPSREPALTGSVGQDPVLPCSSDGGSVDRSGLSLLQGNPSSLPPPAAPTIAPSDDLVSISPTRLDDQPQSAEEGPPACPPVSQVDDTQPDSDHDSPATSSSDTVVPRTGAETANQRLHGLGIVPPSLRTPEGNTRDHAQDSYESQVHNDQHSPSPDRGESLASFTQPVVSPSDEAGVAADLERDAQRDYVGNDGHDYTTSPGDAQSLALDAQEGQSTAHAGRTDVGPTRLAQTSGRIDLGFAVYGRSHEARAPADSVTAPDNRSNNRTPQNVPIDDSQPLVHAQFTASQLSIPHAPVSNTFGFSWPVRRIAPIKATRPDQKWLCAGVLGAGAFGQVLKVRKVDGTEEHALKVYDLRYQEHDRLPAYTRELQVLNILRRTGAPCPYVSIPLDLWRSGSFYFVTSPLCPHGDLAQFRGREQWWSTRLDDLCRIAIEITLGLRHLHDLGMIHGDIKPENILLSEDGHCVITDFGGAVFDFPRGPNVYWEGKRGLGIAGLGVATPNYTAPELRWVHYTGYIYFNKAVDFWALGVMLFEFAMGKRPRVFPTPTREGCDTYSSNIRNELAHELGDGPHALLWLISKLLRPRPSDRLGAEDILKYTLFKDLVTSVQNMDTPVIDREELHVAPAHAPSIPHTGRLPSAPSTAAIRVHDGLVKQGVEIETNDDFIPGIDFDPDFRIPLICA